jgi:hypothetical protein
MLDRSTRHLYQKLSMITTPIWSSMEVEFNLPLLSIQLHYDVSHGPVNILGVLGDQ